MGMLARWFDSNLDFMNHQPFKSNDMIVAKDFPHIWGEVLHAKPCGDLTMRWGDTGRIGGEQAYNMRLMSPIEVQNYQKAGN